MSEGTQQHRERELVSIIIPAYNAAEFIDETLASVLGQTYPSVEIIVVDDGSTDETAAKLLAYGDRISVLTQRNQGQAAARNRGAEIAKGAYLSFLDADDLCDPDKIERQVSLLRRYQDAVACYCDFRTIDAAGATVEAHNALEKPRPSGNVLLSLICGNNISTPGLVLIRRVAWSASDGFSEDAVHRGYEDGLFWLKLALIGSFVYSPDTLFSYRVHDAQVTRKPDYALRRSYSRVLGLEEIRPAIENNPSSYLQQIFREHVFIARLHAAWRYGEAGCLQEAVGFARQALASRPFSGRAWRMLLSSMATALRAKNPQ